MSEATKRDNIGVTQGGDNVFAALGLPNSEERLLKARLASAIFDVIEERGWTQTHAAEVMGITQPDVSNITTGRLKNSSAERLIHFLSRLEQRVTIVVEDETSDLPPKEIVIVAQRLGKTRA